MGNPDWDDIGVLISAAIAVGALVIAILALRQTRRQAAANERMATLTEAEAEERRNRAPWHIVQDSEVRYTLYNIGSDTVYGVRVEGESVISRPRRPEWDEIGPDESVAFFAAAGLNQTDNRVVVSWAREPGGERRRVRRAL